MKVLVIGGGGREHAICWKLKNEENIKEVFCAPGNAGIQNIVKCIDINDSDIKSLKKFVKDNNIDLTIVGPEAPLVMGIVDEFEKEGLKIFGPNKKCAKLEGSKSFSKAFMGRYGIPTAKYEVYTDVKSAIDNIDEFGYPVVIKADGLAAGKGVLICKDRNEAINGLKSIMQDKKFGDAGESIVVEEFLSGIETSVLAFVDNNSIVAMESAKDHKKVFNGETGSNTGGMGTFSPSEIYTKELSEKIKINILEKTLEGFKKEGLDFRGILFVGLMITEDGEKVLEYNVRFGDPETQSVLFRLKTDLNKIILKILEDKLCEISIEYDKESAVCVMLTSGGYPDSYQKEKEIRGIEDVDKDVVVFHSGTKYDDNGKLVTNGGRVLGVTAKGKNVKEASGKVYKNIKHIEFEGMHYRTDIGL